MLESRNCSKMRNCSSNVSGILSNLGRKQGPVVEIMLALLSKVPFEPKDVSITSLVSNNVKQK